MGDSTTVGTGNPGECVPLPTDDTAFVRTVAVADGDVVRLLDAKLNEEDRLAGFQHPGGVAYDGPGRLYVSDTGDDIES